VTDLEKKVARAIYDYVDLTGEYVGDHKDGTDVTLDGYFDMHAIARAAIAICAEEMAKVARERFYDQQAEADPDYVAAAIRAMGKGE
jgi:hypothetical protein